MRIGVLGGAFDPIHVGHLIVVDEVLDRLSLDRLVLVPTGSPWHKSDACHAPADDRMEMTVAAIRGRPLVEVSRVDIDREGPTYTIDTLADLRREYGDGNEWLVVVGADALAGFWQWRDPSGILAAAHVVGVTRPGVERPANDDATFEFVDIPAADVSSSQIRTLIAEGESVRGLVPDAVVELIDAHRLYRRG